MAKMHEKERTSDIELVNRIQEVAKAILNGYSNRKFLLQYISETFKWNVEERTLDNYIHEAKELLKSIDENTIEFEKTMALNRMDALYSLNYKIHDFRECRNIIESRAKLLGIESPQKIDVTTNGEKITNPQIDLKIDGSSILLK